MKNVMSVLGVILLSVFFLSCEKSSESDLNNLTMDLESKKAVNKNALFIGKEFQGGIIFYLDETGKHGLIAAKIDLGPAPWGCYGTSISQARSWDDGEANTQAIIEQCNEAGTAARLCANYVVKENGKKYTDWFMPAYYQINTILSTLKSSSGMCSKTYWVSTEATGSFQAMPVDPTQRAWQRSVSCAVQNPDSYGIFHMPSRKNNLAYVRPIRAF